MIALEHERRMEESKARKTKLAHGWAYNREELWELARAATAELSNELCGTGPKRLGSWAAKEPNEMPSVVPDRGRLRSRAVFVLLFAQ